MNEARIKYHNKQPFQQDGKYILYWMQSTQRIENNFALAYAIEAANATNKPLRVVFCIAKSFEDANERHYAFMFEGLKSLAGSFMRMGIDFQVEIGNFREVVGRHLTNAAAFIMDRAYLKHLRVLRTFMAEEAKKQNLFTVEIDSELIVPLEAISDKLEYAARTIRPKIIKRVDEFLHDALIRPLKIRTNHKPKIVEAPFEDVVKRLDIDQSVRKSHYFHGGEKEAKKQLERFVEEKLEKYHESNDPTKHANSKLSPYLHFGHISPISIYKRVEEKIAANEVPMHAAEAFLEQLLIRRTLSFNFVTHLEGYDRFEAMTHPWAYETMEVHEGDRRETLYTIEDYEKANTHDPYFNAAMREMIETGHMHNYMRMYWGKQIILWSRDYEEAYKTILYLNNKYFLDGRDPNSYAGVAWCFGRHDRAFQEREVLGKLRPLTQSGLKRKFDMDKYIAYTNHL